ncbi:hypothetical protein H6G64_19860 [Calothrix sp. FACHB-156]|nr:hypothetical protein [Calothrix sp. FACHB-156]
MSLMRAIATKFLWLIEHECDRHDLGLLTKCTHCETPFPIPTDWVQAVALAEMMRRFPVQR